MQNIEAENLYLELKKTHINIGTGNDLTIKNLACQIQQIIQFKGEIIWDSSKPNGTLRKQLDIKLMNILGWQHKIKLEDGINSVYKLYKSF